MDDTDVAKKKRTLSVDEIHEILTAIAVDEDSGADRFRALKLLRAEKEADAILPQPMGEPELVERLVRLMRTAPMKLVRLAYVRLTNGRTQTLKTTLASVNQDDIDVDVTKLPTSVKALYRRYPELKRPGVPRGFPKAGSVLAQAEWCRKQAFHIEIERKRAEVQATMEGIKAQDGPRPREPRQETADQALASPEQTATEETRPTSP